MRWSEMLGNLSGRRVTVFGLGREGLDLTRFLVQEGALVRVTDRQPAEALSAELASLQGLPVQYSLGGHPADEVLAADIAFVSPGIDPETPILVEARKRGVPVTSATELFFVRCPAPIVGITGSSGKSTTTALVGAMLAAEREGVVVGGNIGRPLVGQLTELTATSLVVMELSSFQLETVDRSPRFATITNLTPNHLDRHPTMEDYIAAKEQIFRFQGPDDWAVLNADDPLSRKLEPPGRVVRFSLEQAAEGAWLDDERLWLSLGDGLIEVCRADEIALRGRHNLANALTACALATVAGAGPAALRQALGQFRGLPHRLQEVGEIDGVRFVDDSIATSPERSMAGLSAFTEPVVLLAGGRDKHLPMEGWATMIRERTRGVVLFGEAAGLIRAALERAGYPAERIATAGSMLGAAQAGLALAEPGTIVLLSPGGTSYDMFRDFVERGRVYAEAVQDLMREQT